LSADVSAAVLHPFLEQSAAKPGPKGEAAALAAAYICPHCGATPEVGETVSVRHGLICPRRALILKMRLGAA
jgi:hypothetical protein